MLSAALVASLFSCGTPQAIHSSPLVMNVTVDSTLQVTFDTGVTFHQFVDAAVARREGWLRLQRDAVVPAALVTRARAVGGSWQLLVVARDACGDSMNLVPYAARLVDSVPGLTLRIVTPDDGQMVQRTHRTLDGRLATPTFVLLSAQGEDVGCVVELPAPLRRWTDAARATVSSDSLHSYRRTFYARDRGVSLVTELVEVLEAAQAGTPRCDRQLTR